MQELQAYFNTTFVHVEPGTSGETSPLAVFQYNICTCGAGQNASSLLFHRYFNTTFVHVELWLCLFLLILLLYFNTTFVHVEPSPKKVSHPHLYISIQHLYMWSQVRTSLFLC